MIILGFYSKENSKQNKGGGLQEDVVMIKGQCNM